MIKIILNYPNKFLHRSSLAKVNGPAEADDRKVIMVNLCVAFGCTY